MYAVFTSVDLSTSEDEAHQALHSEIIPMLKQAPGFVKGLWFGDDKRGHGVVLFDTEEQARKGCRRLARRLARSR